MKHNEPRSRPLIKGFKRGHPWRSGAMCALYKPSFTETKTTNSPTLHHKVLYLNEIAAQAIPCQRSPKFTGSLKFALTLKGKWSEFPREVSSNDPHRGTCIGMAEKTQNKIWRHVDLKNSHSRSSKGHMASHLPPDLIFIHNLWPKLILYFQISNIALHQQQLCTTWQIGKV